MRLHCEHDDDDVDEDYNNNGLRLLFTDLALLITDKQRSFENDIMTHHTINKRKIPRNGTNIVPYIEVFYF